MDSYFVIGQYEFEGISSIILNTSDYHVFREIVASNFEKKLGEVYSPDRVLITQVLDENGEEIAVDKKMINTRLTDQTNVGSGLRSRRLENENMDDEITIEVLLLSSALSHLPGTSFDTFEVRDAFKDTPTQQTIVAEFLAYLRNSKNPSLNLSLRNAVEKFVRHEHAPGPTSAAGPPSSAESSDDDSGLPSWGQPLLASLAIAIIIVIAVFVYKRRKRRDSRGRPQLRRQQDVADHDPMNGSPGIKNPVLVKSSPDAIKPKQDQAKDDAPSHAYRSPKLAGKGSFRKLMVTGPSSHKLSRKTSRQGSSSPAEKLSRVNSLKGSSSPAEKLPRVKGSSEKLFRANSQKVSSVKHKKEKFSNIPIQNAHLNPLIQQPDDVFMTSVSMLFRNPSALHKVSRHTATETKQVPSSQHGGVEFPSSFNYESPIHSPNHT